MLNDQSYKLSQVLSVFELVLPLFSVIRIFSKRIISFIHFVGQGPIGFKNAGRKDNVSWVGLGGLGEDSRSLNPAGGREETGRLRKEKGKEVMVSYKRESPWLYSASAQTLLIRH